MIPPTCREQPVPVGSACGFEALWRGRTHRQHQPPQSDLPRHSNVRPDQSAAEQRGQTGYYGNTSRGAVLGDGASGEVEVDVCSLERIWSSDHFNKTTVSVLVNQYGVPQGSRLRAVLFSQYKYFFSSINSYFKQMYPIYIFLFMLIILYTLQYKTTILCRPQGRGRS